MVLWLSFPDQNRINLVLMHALGFMRFTGVVSSSGTGNCDYRVHSVSLKAAQENSIEMVLLC